MTRPHAILAVIAAIVVLVVVDELIARYWGSIPNSGVVSEVIVIAAVAYIVIAIATSGRIRLRLPSLPKRRRLRVVKRDPSRAAADFIKQFEDRANR
ncbi:MAG TPA: hypothetical protein VK665_19095 [Candidatus Elarobacter sp.]|nr:hypothetical protein [Candidatus Elarobacter sp.]